MNEYVHEQNYVFTFNDNPYWDIEKVVKKKIHPKEFFNDGILMYSKNEIDFSIQGMDVYGSDLRVNKNISVEKLNTVRNWVKIIKDELAMMEKEKTLNRMEEEKKEDNLERKRGKKSFWKFWK